MTDPQANVPATPIAEAPEYGKAGGRQSGSPDTLRPPTPVDQSVADSESVASPSEGQRAVLYAGNAEPRNRRAALRGGFTWKGFDLAALTVFEVKATPAGVEVPYFTRKSLFWRSKLFGPNGDTRWLGKSRPQIPYGLETLNLGGEAVVLTEGESDALALRLAFPRLPVLGIPGASSWKAEWLTLLDDFSAIYLSFDADAAGEKLTRTVLAMIPFATVIRLPAGADTRDVLQRLGKDAYKLLVDEARRSHECRTAWRALELAVTRRQSVDEAWARAAA